MLETFGSLISATDVDINQYAKLAEIEMFSKFGNIQKAADNESGKIIFCEQKTKEDFEKLLDEIKNDIPSKIIVGFSKYAIIIYQSDGRINIFLLAAAKN